MSNLSAPPPASTNEIERLARLRDADILDSAREPHFDDLARLAALVCGTPMALVSFIDEKRQWFKATFGFEARENSRELAFCSHAIQGTGVMTVEDARLDPRFSAHPLVAGDPGLRFYAAIPILTEDGYALGTIGVLDTRPGTMDPAKSAGLEALARQAIALLRLRQELKNGKLLKSFYEASPQLMGVIELEGERIIHLSDNPATERFFSVPEGQTRAKSAADMGVAPDYIELWVRQYRRALERRRPVEFYYEHLTPRGPRWLQATVNYTGISDHGLPVFAYMAQDITDKRNALRLVAEEQAMLELITSNIGDVIYMYDLEKRQYAYVSQAYEKVWERTRESLKSDPRTFLEAIHPEDRDRIAELLNHPSSARSGATYRIVSPGGEIRWILDRSIPVRGDSSKGTHVVGIATDFTHERERERVIQDQQLRIVSASKMSALGEMAGGIAHEINNPLAIIIGKAGQLKFLASNPAPNLAKLVEGLTKIEGTAERIARIVRGLRSFSRSGESDPFQPVSSREIVTDTLELCRERFKHHEIELRTGTVCDEEVECRSVQISQVLLNLLNNALDAVKGTPNAWVEISSDASDGDILFRVCDSGPGIPAEIAERMMEPFFTTKEIGQGTGLGLSIAHGIAREHRGRLEYDNATGHTRFTLTIPICGETEERIME